ncbi:MAG: phage holin family protein [Tenericutes bacterium]|nr:phage holin family protein [Mycoplasmatota bacterium]
MNVRKKELIVLVLEIFTGALSLCLASYLFKSFYVENFWYACLASVIISLLSVYLKPLLEVLTLPINIITLGLTYPIINMIILKVTGLLLGSNFIVKGFFVPIFISIFISIINSFLNNIIVNPLKERR